MSIDIRRHYTARLKKNRRYYWGRDLSKDNNPKYLKIAITSPSTCSHFPCCNTRKIEGDTLQERKSSETWKHYGIN